MEFLQRHLPRVYQAVQDALNFFTNVTAQMFGAPPDAPRPRDARTKVPIHTSKESEGPTAQEETCDKKETSLVSSTPELCRATEENGDSGTGHPGDEDHGTWETDPRLRKSDPWGRRDLEHKITEGVDIVLQTTAEVTVQSYEIEVIESTESKNIVTVSHDVQSIFNQEQVKPIDQQELKKENQTISVACEIKISQYEELILRTESLSDNEPLRNLEQNVYKDEEHTGEPSSDSQNAESFLYSLSFKDKKELVGIIGQEKPEEEEEKMKCLIEITTESEEYNIDTEQEAQVLVESTDSTVTVEYDVDNILDVIEINKKLVTPADDTECSPYSQKKDRRGTLEDLLETANRLAKHCDSFKKIEVQTGSDTLPDFGETPGSVPELILPKDQGYTEEDLTSADASVAQNTFSIDQIESKQSNLEEETMKAQSLVLEQSRFSGESNNISVEEEKDISTKDAKVSRENEEHLQEIEEHPTKKVDEKHQFKESERQPNNSKKQRIKRRVRFSPSTEDLLAKKAERASRDTLQMVCDDILEGGLREDPEQLGSSFVIKDLAQSPDKDEEGNYLGGSFCSHDDGQSTSEEEQIGVIEEGRTVWYDNYQARTEYDERCESLGDVTNQSENVDFKMEESLMALTESGSIEEHLDDIPSSEDMLSVVMEPVENIDTSESKNFKLEQTELHMENKNEPHVSQEIVNNSKKESVTVSDGTKETVGKEDSFLQEAKSQEDCLLEERTDLLKYDTTHTKEFVDDISQSNNTSDTKDSCLQKDFMDELKQTDLNLEQAFPGQTNPAEDIDKTQLEIISHYSAHKDIIETGSTAEYEAQKEFTSEHLQKTDKSEQDGAEVQEDLLKSFEEQTGSIIFQLEEDTSLGQPVPRNSDDECSETQLSTLVDEICVSVVEDVVLREGLPSEEHKDALGDANVQGESEPLNEISTHDMEEQQKYMNEEQNYDYKHEGFPPETSETQAEDRKVKTGHVELLIEQQCAAEEQHVAGTEASLKQGLDNKQMQDGSEEFPEESYETGQSASMNEVCTSIVQDVLIRESLVSEECSEIFKDVNFEAQSESCNQKTTCDVHEHTAVNQNDDYTHEDFQLDDRESQEKDSKVKIGHIEVKILNEDQFEAEEQLVVHSEHSTMEQLQEDILQGQHVFRDSDEVCHKELLETKHTAPVVEVSTSILENSLKKEDQGSEECNDILKGVNFRAESESTTEIMTYEVIAPTAKNQNDDLHEPLQPDARELLEEDIKVSTGPIEVGFLNEDQFGAEEQFVVHKEHSTMEVSLNEQLQEDILQGQPIFRDSDEVCHKELFETKHTVPVVEVSTSIFENSLKKEDQGSEECNDIIKGVNFRAESESPKETMTYEVIEPTAINQNDYIHEPLQPDAREPLEEDIKVSIGLTEIESLTQEQFVFTDEAFPLEGSKNEQSHEDRLLRQPVPGENDEPYTEKHHETELSTLATDICTSIAEEILIKDSLVSEEDRDVLEEVSLQTETKPHSETSTGKLDELEQHSDEALNANYIYEESSIKTSKSQGDYSKVDTGHSEVGHVMEEQLVAEEQFEEYNEATVIEGSNSDHLQKDILLRQPVSRATGEISPENLHEIQLSASLNEICTSIAENVPIRDGLVSETIREEGFEEEGISHSDTSTCEEEKLQDHTDEEQKDAYINADQLTVTSNSQEVDSEVNTGHVEVENEGQIVAEEQFEVNNEASPKESSSTSDHLQEVRLLGQLESRDSDGLHHGELFETMQSESAVEIPTSLVEDILITEGLMSEELSDVIKDADLKKEKESCNETTTYKVEEPRSANQNNDHTHEDSQLDCSESQEQLSKVKIGHMEIESLNEEQFVVEHQLVFDNGGSTTEGSCNDQLQDKTNGQPTSRERDEESHQELYETEQSTSMVELCTLVAEDILIKEDLISEDLSGLFKNANFTSTEVYEHTTVHQTSGYTHNDFQPDANESQVEDSKEKIDHIQVEFLTEEQYRVMDEACPEEGSNSDQLHEDKDELYSKILHETKQSTLLNEVCTPIAEDFHIIDGIGSEERTEVFTEAGLLQESTSPRVPFMYEVDELQEDTAEKKNNDHLYEVTLMEAIKSHVNDSEVNTVYLEAETVPEEQLEVPNKASPIEGSNIDQLQEDKLPQTISQKSDELNNDELYGTDQSTSVVKVCTSIVDDILRECLVSEELSRIIKDTQFKAESESHNVTTTCDEEHVEKKINNDYTHEHFQPKSHQTEEEDSKLKVGHTESGFLIEEQFVGTDETCQVEGSSNDQLLVERLSEEHREVFREEHSKTDNKSDSITSTWEVDELQEYATEKQNNNYLYEDFQRETSKSQEEDGKLKAGHTEGGFLIEEQFVGTDETCQVEGSSNDQLQEERLSEEHREVFREEHSKTDRKSHSITSTWEVEELQEQRETSKSQEEGNKTKIGLMEVERLPKDRFVVEEQLVFKHETSLTNEDEGYTEEKHNSSNDTYIKDGEEYKPQLEQDPLKLLEESYEEKESSHLATNAQYANTGHTDEENHLDKSSQSQEKDLGLLSEIHSIINYPSLLDQSISMSSGGPDAGLDIQNVQNILDSISIDSGKEMESSDVYVTDIADFEVEKVSETHKELDLLSEIQCTLSPDHTVHGFPEIMDDLNLNGKVTVPLEDQSGAYAREQAPENVRDLDSPSESHLEGHSDSKDMNWRSASDPNYTTGNDLLLEIQAVIPADHTVKTEKVVPAVKLVESDVRGEEEVDEKAETESCLTLGHSEDVTEKHITLETSMVEDQVDDEQKVTASENPGLTHEASQVQGEVNQQDSHFGAVAINTGTFEEVVNLGIISTSAESEMSLTSELYATEIDIKPLTGAGHTQQEVDIVNEGPPSATMEITAIYGNEEEHANTEHRIKEENLLIIQTSYHEDIIRGQEQLLVDETEMSNAVQVKDELDSKVPLHSTLDVSAQKSRVLLLRKTSVRRRPGQRPVTFPSPSPPASPPLNMGVPVFPDKMPALSPPVPPSFESSHPAKEPTETTNTSEPILRRKSSIRRRGQRPVTFQEELVESFMPGITSAKSEHPTEELRDESTTSEQILHRNSSIRRHQGQRPVALEDEPVEPSLPAITPLKMGVPNFLGGMSILSSAVAPASESSHPTEEPTDEGTTSEPMLRRKSSVRRPKVKKPETSEEQLAEPPQSLTAPLRLGVPLFPAIPVTPAPVSSHPAEELKEKSESEGLAIKPKKGFLKHAGFGGAHPGMMQELQARLHKKKPKE